MASQKCSFPLVRWVEKRAFFSIGGYNGSPQKEVQLYSLLKNKWQTHLPLPEPNFGSAALILLEFIYVIGGFKSSHSILFSDLRCTLKPKWRTS